MRTETVCWYTIRTKTAFGIQCELRQRVGTRIKLKQSVVSNVNQAFEYNFDELQKASLNDFCLSLLHSSLQ